MFHFKKIDKNMLIVVALTGVLLLVFTIPTGNSSSLNNKNQSEFLQEEDNKTKDYEKEMEKKVENLLSAMEGVGKVEVMITCKDQGETVVEKDILQQEERREEETVFVQGEEDIPYVKQTLSPEIEGVVVVAEGGKNASVVQKISKAVLALFPIEAHKIVVVEMKQ